MKPSELAIKLEELRSRFEEEWDPEDVKSIAEFIIEYGGSFAVALRHHEALVDVARLAAKRCRCNGTGTYTRACTRCGDSTEDHECNDEERACLAEPCLSARELLATIEREAQS